MDLIRQYQLQLVIIQRKYHYHIGFVLPKPCYNLNTQKLQMFYNEPLPLCLPPLTTSLSGATTLPPNSFQSSRLPPSAGRKVPPGFLALKGQKQTGCWQPSFSLGSGYRQEGGGTKENRTEQANGWRAKKEKKKGRE